MRRARASTGSSLLEVTIALLLLASATIAVLGAQLAMRAAAADSAARATALGFADSWAELAGAGGTTMIDWERASTVLVDPRFKQTMRDGLAHVELRWSRGSTVSPQDATCEPPVSTAVRAPRTCVSLAFSGGGER
ncbi:hypothetical protein [Burkholderia gladioli]|uniref:hypothetical protein n=1 Tax=Burkholderia gladioli TaxID=28095 RepID=UPI0015619AE7|nr:hypothetical protein [Burkholderia gladioli]NRF89159.1 hypothetical protein [Burkholderia gladioli]